MRSKGLAVMLVCFMWGAVTVWGQTSPWQLGSPAAEKAFQDIQSHMQAARHAVADSLWRQAACTFSQKPADQLLFLTGLANQFRLRAKFHESIACYDRCASHFQGLLRREPVMKSYLLEGYADLAMEFSQNTIREKGIRTGKAAYDLLPTNAPRKAVVARKVATLCRLVKDYEEAQAWLDLAGKVSGVDCAENARLLNEIAFTDFKRTGLGDADLFARAREAMDACPELMQEDWAVHYFQAAEFWDDQPLTTDKDVQAENQSEKAARAGTEIGAAHPEVCSHALYNCFAQMAEHTRSLGDYAGAIPYAERALDGQKERGISRRMISLAYSNLANLHHYLGRFADARTCYLQAFLIFPEREPDPNGMRNSRMANYAQELINTGNYQEGEPLMLAAIEDFDFKDANAPTRLAKQYENLGIGYFQQQCYMEGIQAMTHAVTHYSQSKEISWLERCNARASLAQGLAQIGQKKEAEAQIQTCLEELKAHRDADLMDLAMVKETICDYYIQEKNFNEARKVNAEFLQEMIGRRAVIDSLSCPDLDQAVSPWHTLMAASQRATIFWNLSRQTQDTFQLKGCLACAEKALARLRKLRQEHNNEQEKLTINRQWKRLFESAMRAAMELQHQTGNPHYLHKAFEIAEQSKAMLLMEAVLDNRVLENNSANADLVARRQHIQKHIMELRAEINSQKGSRGLTAAYEKLFAAEKELDEIMARIKEANPKYSETVNAFDVVTVSELQALLKEEDRTLVEYFYSDSAIYALVVTPREFAIETYVPAHGFADTLHLFTQSLHKQPDGNDARAARRYAAQSKVILDAIWRPVAPLLTERITIIPDGPLSFISFEALSDSVPAREKLKFQDLGYLLDRHTITYNYSGTFLANQAPLPGAPVNKILAMAPSFGPDAEVVPLPRSLDGVRQFEQEYAHVQTMVAESATKSAFLAKAPLFEIIDLATHGKFDRNNFLNSRIYFSPSGTDDGQLRPNELYVQNIPARLAILEACETGLGDYQAGEGVMSMARAFTYAGCRSVLMSLWEVVEGNSTQQVMQQFFAHMADSLPLDMAIAQAKRKFLVQTREAGGHELANIHPFYWSELVLIGDNSPLPLERREQISQADWAWVGVAVVGIAGMVLVWITYHRRRKAGLSYRSVAVSRPSSGMEASHTQ
jgi:CHAT domain-containing protein/tetratricopeptide (TPR) repeat protein